MALTNMRRLSQDADLNTIAVSGGLAARTVIVGTNGDDMLVGTNGDDLFKPKRGYDTLDGGDGEDRLKIDYSGPAYQVSFVPSTFYWDADGIDGITSGYVSSCRFYNFEFVEYTASMNYDNIGVSIDETIDAYPALQIDGGGGGDRLSISADDNTALFFQADGNGSIAGTNISGTLGSFQNFSTFKFNLGDTADTIIGIDGEMWAGGGDDRLGGGAGAGTFRGDAGADTLTGGGGADLFLYQMRGDSSTKFGIDTITDFSHAEGDLISLYLDADKTISGRQDFTFIGTAEFTAPGQLRSTDNGDGSYTVEANIDRPLQPDLILIVHADAPLVATDFNL